MENFDVFEEDFEAQIGFQKTLTLQELEIAEIFLKRRFPQHSIETIVDKLNKHHEMKKSLGHIPLNFYQNATSPDPNLRTMSNQEIPRRTIPRQEEPNKESAEEKKIREKQNLKLISTLFCQKGVDHDYIKIYIPELTPSSYRSKLQSILNSVLKQLMIFLRKQCNVKLNDLSENQKITIKTALLSAHEWMGVKSTKALQTLLKFICKIYVNRHKLITKQEAIQLYRVIVARVNDQTLDLLFIQPEDQFGDEIREKVRPSIKKSKTFQSQQEVLQLIAETFLDLFNPQKVSNYLLSKYNLDSRFELVSINGYLKQIFGITLAKIDKVQNNGENNFCNTELIAKIMENSLLKVQYSLVQLFLAKKQDKGFERKVIKQLAQILFKKSVNEPQIEEQEKSESQAVSQEEQSIDERELCLNRAPDCAQQKFEKRCETNSIFEEIFEAQLPSSARRKMKQFSSKSSSSKKAESPNVIYFDD